jgi:hypothetical protein
MRPILCKLRPIRAEGPNPDQAEDRDYHDENDCSKPGPPLRRPHLGRGCDLTPSRMGTSLGKAGGEFSRNTGSERDRHRMGAHAVARDAAGGVGRTD